MSQTISARLKIVTTPEGFHELHRNGSPCSCPRVQPVPYKDSEFSAVKLMRIPCSTACVFATVIGDDDSNVGVYETRCTGEAVTFNADIEQPKQPGVLHKL